MSDEIELTDEQDEALAYAWKHLYDGMTPEEIKKMRDASNAGLLELCKGEPTIPMSDEPAQP